jgi:uncharacterized protein with LGFP repeats
MRTLRRAAVFVLLGLILGAPWSAALGARPGRVSPEATRAEPMPLALLQPLWNLLARAWSKEGCTMDPLGRCLPGTAPTSDPQTDEGCRIDPLGGCLAGQ